MIPIFQYSLSASIALFLMWIPYRYALASEKQFSLNRAVIIGIYILSLLLGPALNLANMHVALISGSENACTFSNAGGDGLFRILGILSILWIIGTAITTLLTIYETIKILAILRRCDKIDRSGEYVVYVSHDRRLSPFSFGKSIVMNIDDYNEAAKSIIAHESGHIKSLHSLDMILAQAVAILCWYNPAAWLMRSELKYIHEYQADRHALNTGLSTRTYQLLLIKKTTGSNFPSIGNHLNHSKLKKRIEMMNRSTSTSFAGKVKYSLPLAAIAACIAVFSVPQVKAALSPIPVSSDTAKDSGHALDGMEIFVNGEQVPKEHLNAIPAASIQSITVNKDRKKIDITSDK